MSLWVVDASPLIFLGKLERLPLLRAAADDILVPARVLAEIRVQDDPETVLIDCACKGWLQPIAWQRDMPEPSLGELTVIELAIERGADRVVLDDFAARRLAPGGPDSGGLNRPVSAGRTGRRPLPISPAPASVGPGLVPGRRRHS